MMKGAFILLFCLLSQPTFLAQQLSYERVKLAQQEKEPELKQALAQLGLKLEEANLLLVALKSEQILQVYVKHKRANKYQLLLSYPICRLSGKLGPKSKAGDLQTPEGFYYIDRFNASSTYYLSLGINYPNANDKRRSKSDNPGGDIFIHGKCVTIGCLPITDENIKTLYLLAIHAHNNGQQRIPVYIFPYALTTDNMKRYQKEYENDKVLLAFWKQLKTGYDKFYSQYHELQHSAASDGAYVFK